MKNLIAWLIHRWRCAFVPPPRPAYTGRETTVTSLDDLLGSELVTNVVRAMAEQEHPAFRMFKRRDA